MGTPNRQVCDGASCQLFLDGAPLCSCSDISFDKECSNGVPTCNDWTFSYVHVTEENGPCD